jgi:putative colanic acid biosynthesis acetyltransferase WcaF
MDEHRHVISLSTASSGNFRRTQSRLVEAAWILAEWAFITNALQPSSAVRRIVLRAFGAQVGKRVLIRSRVRVKFPWNLSIGDDCWIGEGAWFHNQARLTIEHDVAISQETFISTGSHAFRKDMSLEVSPIHIKSGAWITSRAIVLRGVTIGHNALITPGTVVRSNVPDGMIVSGNPGQVVGPRFRET